MIVELACGSEEMSKIAGQHANKVPHLSESRVVREPRVMAAVSLSCFCKENVYCASTNPWATRSRSILGEKVPAF
jgi:hypothetical protein